MDIAFVVLLGVLGSSDVSLSSSTVDAEQLKGAELVLQGMCDSRERLVSGVCRIRGTNKSTKVANGDQETVTEESVDCHCSFDFEKGLYRFDRNTPPIDGRTRGGKFIRTPSHIYETLAVDDVRAIMRNRSDADPSSIIAPFDIRCVGLFNLVGPYWKTTIDEFCDMVSKGELVEFSEESDDIYRLMWKIGQKDRETLTLWLDAAKGYSWIRMDSSYVGPKATVRILTETSWDEIGGAWVPTALRLTDDQSKRHTEAEWTIEWESVNEPVLAKRFEPDDFSSRQQVSLYSEELGKPVFLGTVGGGGGHSVLEMEEQPPANKWLRILVVALGLVLLTTLLVLFGIRRLRHA